MKLIFGLGNPGKDYENTRHNAGFLALDYLKAHFSFPPFTDSSRHRVLLAEGIVDNKKVMLVKPLTYMNLSGEAVRSVMQFYKLAVNDLLFIYDEADLPLGTVRLRREGSSAGHNGVKSLMAALGTGQFTGIRIGIASAEPFLGKREDFVLGRFSAEELVELKAVFEKLPEKVMGWLAEGSF